MTPVPAKAMVCPVLVGRDEPLRATREALQAARGAPLIRVFGEAGIGKSRLVSEAVRGLRGERVLRAASFEADRLLPLALFIDLLDNSAVAGGDALVQRIGPHARQRGDTAEWALTRRQLFDELAAVVLGEHTVLVLEDLHWSDETSLDAVYHLARRAGPRARLLVTYRDDEVASPLESFLAAVERARLAVDVPLRRLTRAEVAAMAHAVTGARPRRRAVDALVEVTDGNPFFVEEVLGAAVASNRGPLAQEADGDGAVEEVPIPRTVQEAVRRRFDELGSEARRVACVAATAGRRFDLELLAELVGLDDEGLSAAVRELLSAHLAVQTAGGAVEFRHELTRRAVYDRLIGHERRRLHHRIAAALERSAADEGGSAGDRETSAGDPEPRAGDLARHYALAGQWEPALHWAERAARHAEALYSPQAAALQYERAVDAARRLGRGPSPELLQARARAYETIGDLDAAIADHEAALRSARNASDQRAAWHSLVALGGLWVSRDWQRAEACLDEALTLCRAMDDPVALGRTLNRVGNLRMIRGEQEQARRLHEQALALFETLDADHDLASTLDLVAVTTLYAGDLHAARDHYARVEALFRGLDDRAGVANALVMRALCGGAHFLQTFVPALDSAEAVRLAERSVRIAHEIGWHGESFALYNLAAVLAEAGRLGDALDRCGEALRLADEIEHLPWMLLARYGRGMALLDALVAEEAHAELTRAVELGESFDAGVFLAAALAGKARAEAALGRFDEAVASIARAEASAPGLLTTRAARHARAVCHLAAGEADEGLALVDELLATTPRAEHGPPPALGVLRGEILLAQGRDEDAEAAFREVNAVARRLGKAVAEGQALAGLARAQERVGRPRRAVEATARLAVEAADRLAAGLPREHARASRERARARIPGYAPRAADAQRYGGLTPRQREVAALLAQGLTNRQIAETLVISPLTAETHVKHILTRLGLTTRAQVAAWATQRGLVDTPRPHATG